MITEMHVTREKVKDLKSQNQGEQKTLGDDFGKMTT